METDNDYLVKNPKVIVNHLTDIYKNRCIISAHFGEENSSFLTLITDYQPKKNSLIIDGAPTDDLNIQLLNSANVIFRTQLNGVKASFVGKRIKKISHGDRISFAMELPNSVFWLQRRQYYRVKIPLSHTQSFCEMSSGKSIAQLANPLDDTIILRLTDLSINGFASINATYDLNNLFVEDKEFIGCQLHLNDGKQDKVSFVVKEITEIKLNNNTQEQRIGCLFTDVSPSFESNIQLYMQFIELQKRKLGMY
ncbi:flagellar brake protein [Methylomonas sp. AM2-LC]|uniref:flagellar brake protein n=1 Tax=Methylomonas sp. AM2-LC TaxID=3153301 RepID=UPI003267F30D